jgi:hypothetical protein
MSATVPVAFFATRDFDAPRESRLYTHLKVLGDPEYTVFINGRESRGTPRRRHAWTRRDTRARSLRHLADREVGTQSHRDRRARAAGRRRFDRLDRHRPGDRELGGDRRQLAHLPPLGSAHPAGDPAATRGSRRRSSARRPIGRWNYLATREQPLASPPNVSITPPNDVFAQMGVIPRSRPRAASRSPARMKRARRPSTSDSRKGASA